MLFPKKNFMASRFSHMTLRGAALLIMTIVGAVALAFTSHIADRAQDAEKHGDIPLAIGQYYICLKEYSEDLPPDEQRQAAEMFKHAGDLCVNEQRLIEAIEFYTTGYKAANKCGHDEMLMGCLGNIGNVYAHFDDYNRAISYYQRALDAANTAGSEAGVAKALINMTTASALMGQVDNAKEYFRRYKMLNLADQPDGEFHSNRLQGLIASATGHHSGAIYYYKAARQSAIDNKLAPPMIANQNMQTGMEFMNLNQPDSAKLYLDRALQIANKNDIHKISMNVYSILADIERINGDSITEQKYRAEAKRINDTLFNLRAFNNARTSLDQYEEMLKTTQIENLNNRLTIMWLVTGFVALLLTVIGVAAVIIKRRNGNLIYANKTLLEKNRELIRNEEKNRILMDKYLDALYKNEENKKRDAMMKNEEIAADPKKDVTVENENGNTTSASESPSVTGDSAKEPTSPYLSNDQVEILLMRINRVLNDNETVFNPEFSLNMLAQMVKSNTKYVSWVINDTYGRNFKTLLNERRIREASKRLEDFEHYGNVTIQSIGEEVGYRTSASFIQSFKKIIGMTPSVYQKLALNKPDRDTEDTETDGNVD